MLLALILASVVQFPETDYSKGSRTLFGELAELDMKNGRLAVRPKDPNRNTSSLRTRTLGLFPGVSRVSVQTNRGSSSTSRGSGSGQVSIRIRNSGGNSTLAYRITAGGGQEKIVLEQGTGGKLELEIENDGSRVRLEQNEKTCSLEIKAGKTRLKAKGPSLSAIFQEHPLEAREHLFGAIERYFGDPPFKPLPSAPAGKTVVRLRDGAVIFGEIDLESVSVQTDYGRLTIPRSDVLHVLFPGARGFAGAGSEVGSKDESEDGSEGKSEEGEPTGTGRTPRGQAVVITPRFTPHGRIDIRAIRLNTPYGTLEIEASEVLHIAFGAVEKGEDDDVATEEEPVAADR